MKERDVDPSEVETGDDVATMGRVACDAETLRRAGNPSEARKVAEEALRDDETPALRVALGLTLLDLGDDAGGRAAFERAFALLEGFIGESEEVDATEASTFEPEQLGRGELEAIGDAELENAFLEAESSPDEMWNANHLAEAALAQIEEGVPEGVSVDSAVDADSPFATATVAGLLEEQGHTDEAIALRQAISAVPESDPTNDRSRIIATLELWLDNLRRAS